MIVGPDNKRMPGSDGPMFMGGAGNGGPPGMGGVPQMRPGFGGVPPGVGGAQETDDISVPDKMVGLSEYFNHMCFLVVLFPIFDVQ